MAKADNPSIEQVKYRVFPYYTSPKNQTSIQPIGIDTEAYLTGRCFMICTSNGDVFTPDEFPACLFTREYRGKVFVAYNLKYDEGALLQSLPLPALKLLQETNATEFNGYVYKVIPRKQLIIRRGKNAVTFYDMLNFFGMKLDDAASMYLGRRKIEQSFIKFWPYYANLRWDKIAAYCIRDAELVRDLAAVIIKKFESYGIFPKKLYSVAYVSFQYFRSKTSYVIVKRYWQNYREALGYAMESYNGGKFEVTTKGLGYFYEYDLISAYPAEIADLVDISYARVVKSTRYRRGAVYAFLRCKIKIPYECYSPCVVKRGMVNTFPVGEIERTITKTEYEYLINHGADVTIIDGYFLHLDSRPRPYRREILRLVDLKERFKQEGKDLDYHTVKIICNSLYGKFVQLIKKDNYYEATSSWNPFYGSVITANVRCKMSEMQSRYKDCVAVHTDSIITTSPVKTAPHPGLGELEAKGKGEGLILGSGIYQIGEKVKFRGFSTNTKLTDFIGQKRKSIKIGNVRPWTWREVAFFGWDTDLINRFDKEIKKVSVNFDTKRLWLDEWESFADISKRSVESCPLIVCSALY